MTKLFSYNLSSLIPTAEVTHEGGDPTYQRRLLGSIQDNSGSGPIGSGTSWSTVSGSGPIGLGTSQSATSLSSLPQEEQAEVESNQHHVEPTNEEGAGSGTGLSAESLPAHPPLLASAERLRGQMMNHEFIPRSQRQRFKSHVDLISSSMVDMIHNFERQREIMEETLQRLQPIHDNHVRILQILSDMHETIQKEF